MGDHLCIGPDVLAVWTGGTDLGPVNNPGAHPGRVRFNSLQENIGFLRTPRTGTYRNEGWFDTLPQSPNEPNSLKVRLFSHGLNYRPFLFGWLRVAGTNLPINGSIFHASSGGSLLYSYTIGADSSHVYLNIMRTYVHFITPPSPNLSYTIYLSSYGVTSGGSLRRPPYFNGVDINAGAATPYIKAGYFDTAFLYPYRTSGGSIAVPNRETISGGVGIKGSGGNRRMGFGYRYRVLGHTVQDNASNMSSGSGYSQATGNSASFNASVTRVGLGGGSGPKGGFEFDPSSGAVLYGPNGDIVWSSARRQMYWTDYVNGSFVINALPSSNSTSTITNQTINLKRVSSNATHIMGSFTATQSGGYDQGGVATGGIHQLGGTTLLMTRGYTMYPSNPDVSDYSYSTLTTGVNESVAGAITLTTFVEDGWLKARVHRSKPAAGTGSAWWAGVGVNNVTIAYQGIAYTFDN